MISTMGMGGSAFSACSVAYGLYEGPDREEKRALRRAELAERAFRASKGYLPDTIWSRLCSRLSPR